MRRNDFIAEYLGPVGKQPRRMIVDKDERTGCGWCLITYEASSSGSGALRIEERVAMIGHNLCTTYNTCRIVCPEGTISVVWDPASAPTAV